MSTPVSTAKSRRSRRARVRRAPLRCATYLAPNLHFFYDFVCRALAASLDREVELCPGSAYEHLADHDLAFVCGLAYVEHTQLAAPSEGGDGGVVPLAAPVLRDPRYQGKPIYFSDVIVHRDSPYRSFADLRGRTWAYNERHSQSGYGITRHTLLERGETAGYFGRVIEAGWHEEALRLVATRAVDGSAIDSHVLAVALRERPGLAETLRIVDSLGPSTIQPLVASTRLSERLRSEICAACLALADDPAAREHFTRAGVERFVPVDDASYHDIRAMLAAAEQAQFSILH